MIPPILDTACQQGFLYAIAFLGIALTLRIMNWPDLTVDGSFTLGAAVVAVMIQKEFDPLFGMLAAAIAGFIAGTATFILNRKLGISKILSGILIMLMLYSVNLRIMGRANISLLRLPTLFSGFDNNGPGDLLRVIVFLSLCLAFLAILCYLMLTRLGLFVRATGDNEFMVRGLGVNTDWPLLIGLGLSNALVAVSGALVAQNQGFADVNMGIGIIVTGIAALIIGESLMDCLRAVYRIFLSNKNVTDYTKPPSRMALLPWETFSELFAAFVGAFAYFLILAICLRLGLPPTDLKLATGLLVIVGIAFRLKGPTVETYSRGKL